MGQLWATLVVETFDDHAHVGFDIFQFSPRPENIPSSPVARVDRKTVTIKSPTPDKVHYKSLAYLTPQRDFSRPASVMIAAGIVP